MPSAGNRHAIGGGAGCSAGSARTAYNELKRLREAARFGGMTHGTQSEAQPAGKPRVPAQRTEEFGAAQAGTNKAHAAGQLGGKFGGQFIKTPGRTLGWQMQALRAGGWEVFYDGDCDFCRRWAARGARWGHPQIAWRNFREHGGEVAHLSPRFDQAAYLIINREIALPGFFAFRKLALASPRLWPLVPLAYFPGTRWLGPAVYRWIAHRYGPLHKDAACQIR